MKYEVGDIILCSIPGITDKLCLCRVCKSFEIRCEVINLTDIITHDGRCLPTVGELYGYFSIGFNNIDRKATLEDIKNHFVDLL